MNLRRAALRHTISATLLAAGLIAMAWLTASILIGHEFDATVASEQRQNENLVLAFEAHTRSTIRAVDEVLEFVRIEYEQHGNADPARLDRMRHVDGEAQITVLIADAGGSVVTGSNALEAMSVSDHDFFLRHRDRDNGRALVSAPYQVPFSGRVIVPISRRMNHPDGSFAGVVVAGIDPGSFVDYYGKMEMGYSSMVQIAGLDGIVRVRRTGSYVSSRYDVKKSTLFKQQAARDAGSFLSGGVQEGVPRYVSYRTLRDLELVVAVGTAVEDVLAANRHRRITYLVAAGLFSATVVLVAGLVLLSIRRGRRFLEAALRSEAQFHATFNQAAIGVAHISLDGRFLKVNETMCRLLGFSEADLRARVVMDLKPPAERAAVAKAIAMLVQRGAVAPFDGAFVRKDGSPLWASVAPVLVCDPDGAPEYLVAMVQDIGERKAAQEELLHQAQYDPLTALPNRTLFADRLRHALGQARRHLWTAAVLFIDLDGFKAVNDKLGHAAGDTLLREVARRLAEMLRSGDTAARLGGDEFAVVLTQITKPEDAAFVAAKILRALGAFMMIEGEQQVVTASIGIALFPYHGDDEESLMRAADGAMFEAKQAGKNAFRMHDPARKAWAA